MNDLGVVSVSWMRGMLLVIYQGEISKLVKYPGLNMFMQTAYRSGSRPSKINLRLL